MKILYKISIAVCLILTFTACEKDLTDLQPIDQIPAEKAIVNMADLGSAVNGVYGTWQARRSIYISTLISDEARLGTGTGYRNVGNALFNWQFVADSQDWRDIETGGVWTNLYSVIDRANRVLFYMNNVPATATADIALKAQYQGEMLAVRAMAHLELLRCFSRTNEYTTTAPGVVLQTAFVTNPATYRPARNTQKEVIDQVSADLLGARTLIPTTFTDISRVTRNAVIATQARVAMHIKDWQGVIDRATEVINLQALTTDSLAYSNLWTLRAAPLDQSSEVIWKLNINSSNVGFAVGSLWQDAGGAVQASAAQKLFSTFNQAADIRFKVFFRIGSPNLIAKYATQPAPPETFIYDIKMIRTSELVLARAEAYAELNNLPFSNTDLSRLRTARIKGYVHVAITDKPTLINEILLERYKELCYEGQRYFDLRRRSIPVNRDVSDIGGIAASQTLLTTDNHYILPIPFQEIQANPTIQQNVGY